MTIVAPQRSSDQRRDALLRANAIRVMRAALKRNVLAGTASVLTVLGDPAPEVATMKVRDLLLALPKWGPQKADRLLLMARVSHAKTVGGMSERQRREVADQLWDLGIR